MSSISWQPVERQPCTSLPPLTVGGLRSIRMFSLFCTKEIGRPASHLIRTTACVLSARAALAAIVSARFQAHVPRLVTTGTPLDKLSIVPPPMACSIARRSPRQLRRGYAIQSTSMSTTTTRVRLLGQPLGSPGNSHFLGRWPCSILAIRSDHKLRDVGLHTRQSQPPDEPAFHG